MMYDLIDLKVFLAVAEESNLSRGAERCHLAPSSVSLRIKGLEASLGTPLLLRQAQGRGFDPGGSCAGRTCKTLHGSVGADDD